jgi:hypothetical protein
MTIAKFYVQAELEHDGDTAYALYTDRKDFVQWSKEEDKQNRMKDTSSVETIYRTFQNLTKGTFVKVNDFQGYIKFNPTKDTDSFSGFQLVKDEDGIWNVGFMPIQ